MAPFEAKAAAAIGMDFILGSRSQDEEEDG